MGVQKADFLICGSGIVGLTIASELVKSGCENIVLLEKEEAIGRHASGRNSGVLHAGIYYSPDSLRAKVCLEGNLLMKRYCREKGLRVLETGKVIVARDENELETLKELYRRALKNGAEVELVDEKQLAEIEPNAATRGLALYSRHTAVVEPKSILKSLYDDLVSTGKARILTGTRFLGLKGSRVALTNRGEIRFGTFINSAGAYSDKIAHMFSVGLNYRLIPFKGAYRKLSGRVSASVRGNIYPVPEIRNPFLGVHFTRSVDGDVYIGPTAMPVFGRESCDRLDIGLEALEILYRDAVLFIKNPRFREVAMTEPRKYLSRFFFDTAKGLVKDLGPEDIEPSGKAGIRPQLVDWNTKEMIMDFIVVRDGDSVHVLNAISPAFTSSIAFARFIMRDYIKGER
jgi:L-2-hydroxyglutarate oxidase LhgO